eukprot:maker-scaffold420_size176246-snap-gene-0.24 protein:Tk05635 transcript:maker-scaffold420_size176246-snap-gene-0.24-mRNA-1 annotation:"target of rapamycin"
MSASMSGGGAGASALSNAQEKRSALVAIQMSQSGMISQVVSDLKSRVEERRAEAALELFRYVSTELREVPVEELNAFLDIFTKQILDLVKGDAYAKLGGILAIVALINADVCNTGDRISRFGNYLRNNCLSTAPSSSSGSSSSSHGSHVSSEDFAVIELASKAIARLTQVSSGTYTANLKFELIDHEVKRAFELLQGDKSEGKRFAAVLILREIAFSMPTFFFQNVSQFFDVIFHAVRDPKLKLRESSVNALRAGLWVTAKRETTKQSRHQHQSWYTHLYEAAIQGFDPSAQDDRRVSREDRIHGSLLVLCELLRCSNYDWEMSNRDIEEEILCGDPLSQGANIISTRPLASPEKQGGLGAVRKYYQSGFKLNRSNHVTGTGGVPIAWFGTVEVGKEDVVESTLCRNMLNEHYDQICHKVLTIARSPAMIKNINIQNALLLIFPKLAAFRRELFSQKCLGDAVPFIDRLLLDKNRYNAFIAMGLLAVAVGPEIQPHLRTALTQIRLCLPHRETPNKKRSVALDPAIFACVSLLARAVRHAIRHEVSDMLDAMLCVGLSPALTVALNELAKYIPTFKKDIADGLLKILSLILMQQSFKHPGTPKRLITHMNSPIPEVPDTASVVLGLRTLGSFDFEGHSLLQFVRHCADNYLNSEEKLIRLEAVETCSSLLKQSLISQAGNKSQTIMSTINEVLAKLLIVGITDQEPKVRSCVMNCLDECFDYHLAQAENLSALFVAMNDECFEIREQTVCIIGRLCHINPAYIMPSLRKTLIQLLTEMEFSGVGRNKEQSARMLGHLVANAPTLIRPYIEPILKVLMPKLKETDLSPMVITSVLRAIGDLSREGLDMMNKYVDELLPMLLDILNDASSSQKREVCLWTLSQLILSTGCVVEPYHRYPTLLDTLLGFLRTEQRPSIRTKTLRLLGLLGALDPYRHKMNIGQIDSATVTSAPLIPMSEANDLEQSWEMTPSELLVNMGTTSLDDFYPSVAIATLMKIVRDPTLSQHHTEVVQAVTFIFRALGIKSVPYIPQVIPSMINVIRSSDVKFHDNLFRQMGILISIVQQHIRKYLEDIFTLIREYWTVDSPLQPTIIGLVENISSALGCEFKIYLPLLIPQILRVLAYDASRDRQVTGILLKALIKFGNTLGDYMHLILPKIVALFDMAEVPVAVRRSALVCIASLSESLDFSEYASLIIHPIVRCLDKSPELRSSCMDTLTAIVGQLGKKYVIFIPMVKKKLIQHNYTHQRYDILCARVLEGGTPSDFDEAMLRYPRNRRRPDLPDASASGSEGLRGKRLPTSANLASLQEAWTVSRRVSKDDWLDWYSRLCSELLKASPSPALRACWTVAQHHSQLAKDLFNASFVSCWTELDVTQQDELMQSLEQAIKVLDLPEISQTILNLAEFMEHCDKGPLPLDQVLLGETAIRCKAYAKALHYKEDEFKVEPKVPVLEALISINNKLGQKEAAAGLLEWGEKNLEGNLQVQERWHEKLHDWEKALKVYQEKSQQSPNDPELIAGRMRCLEALGEWGELHEVANNHWNVVETREGMARMAASAALGMGDWPSMAKATAILPREGQDGAFYRAILCIHQEQWIEACNFIELTRKLLDTEIAALSSESYQRAYPTMIAIQMLAELDEVIEYKLNPERQPAFREMWWKRLQGVQRVVEDWQRIMHVRSLVISPQTDQRTWLKYASLCRKSGRLQLSHRTLVTILGTDPSTNLDRALPTHHPQATFAYCKHIWSTEQKDVALSQLQVFVQRFLQPSTMQMIQEARSDETVRGRQKEMSQLLARCYHKLGQWQEHLKGISDESIPTILQYFAAATEHDNTWYKAWHSFAVMNFETVLFFKHQKSDVPGQPQPPGSSVASSTTSSTMSSTEAGTAVSSRRSSLPVGASPQGLTPKLISIYGVPALKGFVRSISLSKGSSLQDTLRLLTLLFDYGHQSDMYEALHEGLKTIEIDNWLQVIPQLIARIDTPRHLVSRLIHQILMDLGKHHPQALVYSLTVACKSNNATRKTAANKILNKMKEGNETLVIQAMMVSDELIRVAILWHEQWHEGLEEASRLYFGECNIPGMLAVLEPLHQMLEKGPQTLKETSFHQAYGNDLNEAKRWCQRYKLSDKRRDLNQAWDLYYHVFRRISRQLPKLTQLELQHVSPQLLQCRNLELAVPGNYVPNRPIIRIAEVEPSLQVITSKQRPRKTVVRGSDGKSYMFLLKGHEDLRQDERVMQFFSLVNSLLLNDPETFRRNLTIQRFAVIPLSTNSGLIGWVPNSDTLHALIKDYREKKKILLNIEHRIMQKMTPNSDHLPLMNKVEVFEHALESTPGDDLAKILLLKAPSSEVWFDRRTNFTRSLAVMSMVGYVLGLGDRHPSNLLLDRMSGKILHIDFGDCFEVAMTREKFPEKIPFRLTRMLINAMEVTGIEGTYRRTCESVVHVLRNNRDSLMAVLEAFVYDPLLNWRLMETGPKAKRSKPAQPGDQYSTNSNASADLGSLDAAGAASNVRIENVSIIEGLDGDGNQPEILNKKALDIIQRVRDKLTGRDFSHEEELAVREQPSSRFSPTPCPTMIPSIVLSPDVHRSLICHALINDNEEIMGHLFGQVADDGKVVFIGIDAIPRSDKTKDRVEISPEHAVQSSEKAEALGLRVLGWYHSHPHHTVWPSQVDLRTQGNFQGMDKNFVGVICSVFSECNLETQGRKPSFSRDDKTPIPSQRICLTCFQTNLGGRFGGEMQRIDIPIQVDSELATKTTDIRLQTHDIHFKELMHDFKAQLASIGASGDQEKVKVFTNPMLQMAKMRLNYELRNNHIQSIQNLSAPTLLALDNQIAAENAEIQLLKEEKARLEEMLNPPRRSGCDNLALRKML